MDCGDDIYLSLNGWLVSGRVAHTGRPLEITILRATNRPRPLFIGRSRIGHRHAIRQS